MSNSLKLRGSADGNRTTGGGRRCQCNRNLLIM
jgi:hypothetical protein